MQMRRKFTMSLLMLAGAVVLDVLPGHAQVLTRPDGWRADVERFVAMPPGFHITTSGSSLLYHPEASAEGEFVVESEGYLFSGDAPHSYGVFVGGAALGSDAATWTSFEVSPDRTWTIVARATNEEGRTTVRTVAGPEPAPVALPSRSEGPARNVLRVEAGAEAVAFVVNGESVASLPRNSLSLDGVVGFRVGSALNLHLTTLTITSGGTATTWAPAPEEEAAGDEGEGEEEGGR